MNPIQLGIVVVVGILISILIGYFWYQEVKFKKLVEKNFNYKTDDVILTEENLVMDGVSNEYQKKPFNVLDKDIANLFNDEVASDKTPENLDSNSNPTIPEADSPTNDENYPSDSVEALFVNFKKINFPFAKAIDVNLDYVVNIVFEEPIKIKILPDISSFTQKTFQVFVLDNQSTWCIYQKGHKYNNILGLKVVVYLVDKNGIINHAQLENLYRELFKFAMQYKGFIEQSNYQASIFRIREQVKYLNEFPLDLELYLIMKEALDYNSLANFFMANRFTQIEGKFNYSEDGRTQYVVADENGNAMEAGRNYKLLKITSNLHKVASPKLVLDNIFELSERFMERFESRILTTNKQVFSEREFSALNRYVNNYIGNAKKYGVELGGELIRRLL